MSFKEQFPILIQCTYLNTASSVILSASLLDWRRNHDLEFFNQGSEFRLNQAIFLQQIKQKVADFFYAKAINIFLVPNFSYGFNIFLEGLSGTHRFLLLRGDYPSVNYALECRRFSCDYIEPDELLETTIFGKISIVQYINGFKIDLKLIKKLKEKFPALLIVADETPYCGTEDINFDDSGLDFLTANGYKWMLAGYFNGFVLLKNELASILYVYPEKINPPKELFLQSKNKLSFYFEHSHQDRLSFGILYQSICS